jgi:hypothetical protein
MGKVPDADGFKMPKLGLCSSQLRTLGNTQAHCPHKPAFGTQDNEPESMMSIEMRLIINI